MNLLLISPSISDMYKDIMFQIESMNIEVDYIEDKGDFNDPDFIRINKNIKERELNRSSFEEYIANKWKKKLYSFPFNKVYDFLLVIDGMSISPIIFDILKTRNPNIWCSNYLYDSTISLYRFQKNFKYFDYVASFDKRDCSIYNLHFLPIYWVDEQPTEIKYKFFAVGGFSVERYKLFKLIGEYSKKNKFSFFCKLYHPNEDNYLLFLLKYLVKKIKGQKNIITPMMYNSEYVVASPLSASKFRYLLLQSDIVVDSVNFEQDGMTARFMWALGLGKKIITTNRNILEYECYDSKQILVIDDNLEVKTLSTFVGSIFEMSQKNKDIINQWRIDKWVSTLLNIEKW